MATKKNTQRMTDALKRARADIASLTDWLELELDKAESNGEVTWAMVNSVEHMRELLIENLESISGIDRKDIQRSLDEQRL